MHESTILLENLQSMWWIALAAVLAPVLALVTRRAVPDVVWLLVLGIVIGPHALGLAEPTEAVDFLRELGADELIDYRDTDVAEAVSGVDVVFDTIGGETALQSLRVLRPGGILVSILPVGSDELYTEADRLGVRALRMLVDSSRHNLYSLTELVDRGALRPTIAAVFSLDEAAEAHRLGETGRTTGKMVLTPR